MASPIWSTLMRRPSGTGLLRLRWATCKDTLREPGIVPSPSSCQSTACIEPTWNTRVGTCRSCWLRLIRYHIAFFQALRPAAGELASTLLALAQPHALPLPVSVPLPRRLRAAAVGALVGSAHSIITSVRDRDPCVYMLFGCPCWIRAHTVAEEPISGSRDYPTSRQGLRPRPGLEAPGTSLHRTGRNASYEDPSPRDDREYGPASGSSPSAHPPVAGQ